MHRGRPAGEDARDRGVSLDGAGTGVVSLARICGGAEGAGRGAGTAAGVCGGVRSIRTQFALRVPHRACLYRSVSARLLKSRLTISPVWLPLNSRIAPI